MSLYFSATRIRRDTMSTSEPPGELVGIGRAADVYAIGNGRVLRRSRFPGYDSVPEATIMRHLAAHGFPVPEVFDADGTDLVMERLDGRDMLIDLGKRPWLARQHARVLADMHNALHQIEAPAGMRHLFGPGNRVMHLDLHPANVMLTARGPYVIDWPNAAAGPGGADVAMAYLIMASSEADGVPAMVRPLVNTVRGQIIKTLLATAADDPWPHIAEVAENRLGDRNVRPGEAVKLRQLAAAAAARSR
jgi:aminoglycoside phosphotransferase (APT) family kinase protein